ncbi:hypothetical protein F5Y15DRAFT_150571 [Xylariaceae sp. FL0016]|nr:hypothetical protein F5Y15DRAFT_150571 [Xylariaceae sp. FL0016]
MSLPSSARPQTSVPLSEGAAPSDGHSSVPHVPLKPDPYVPTVLDFVNASRSVQAADLREHAPWLVEQQAINSSIHIGSGASFSVSRMTVPKGQQYTSRQLEMGNGLLITQSAKAPELPKAIVYKTARIRMEKNGKPADPESKRAAISVLTEIAALAHPPLAKHENIVKLLGLAWGSNPYDTSFKLPVIILEYADFGTVADIQTRTDLTSSERLQISLDVANGLDILHRCSIVHGDVKAENVLVFASGERKYVAKLADFGFSVVGRPGNDNIRLGGTEFWRAPETFGAIRLNEAAKTDVYSFGLFTWRLFMRGINPFALFLPPRTPKFQEVAAIRQLKLNGSISTEPKTWLWDFIAILGETSTANIAPHLRQQMAINGTTQMLQLLRLNANTTTLTADQLWNILLTVSSLIALSASMKDQFRLMIEPMIPKLAEIDVLASKLGPLLENCLSKDLSRRHLGQAIQALRGQDFQAENTLSMQDPVEDFKSHSFSWQWMRDLEPAVQSFVFSTLREDQEEDAAKMMVKPPQCFWLSSLYINGFGTDPNPVEGVRLLQHAAKYGMQIAKAYHCRFATSLDVDPASSDILKEDLVTMGGQGSHKALEDLLVADPELWNRTIHALHEVKSGIGASFFSQSNLLHDANIGMWLRTLNEPDILVKNFSRLQRIQDYKVNRRGDGVLHMAASMGKLDSVTALLDNFPDLTVDQRNDLGETPLLCACRAGHSSIAKLLLDRNADASLATPSNESPLHWLISLQDDDIPEIGALLLQRGASLTLRTNGDIHHVEFPSSLMVDRLPPGIPLHWAVVRGKTEAVRFLVDKDPDKTTCLIEDTTVGVMRALDLAALWHISASLIIMVEAMEGAKVGQTYSPLVVKAVQGADRFSMILRNGVHFERELKATLDVLLKRVCIHTVSSAGRNGRTIIFSAVSLRHDLVVRYLLDPKTNDMIEEERERRRPSLKEQWLPTRQDGIFHVDHINLPCGMQRLTPFHEAVRTNQVAVARLLLEHGANPRLCSQHPFVDSADTWTPLHIFAFVGHSDDLSLVRILTDAGAPVDGCSVEAETPLLVSLQNNAFKLASELLRHGAEPNYLSLGSGLRKLSQPTTILGHIIAMAEQDALTRVKYLLRECEKKDKLDFIIEPERQITALQRVAWAHRDIAFRTPKGTEEERKLERRDYDFAANREIAIELLHKFCKEEHINAISEYNGWTALHFAVDARNPDVARLLLEHGADKTLVSHYALTPLEFAESSAVHVLVQCDGCGSAPLRGTRWRCETCPDHDVCDECRDAPDHAFQRHTLGQTLNSIKDYPKVGGAIGMYEEMLELQRVIDVLVS